MGHRTSINFFAILSKDLPAYRIINGRDDEHEITCVATKILKRHNSINPRMTVSHLSFYKQRTAGLNDERIREMYRGIAKKSMCKIRVKRKLL